jgi:S1-C subfamily serine protease
VNGVPVKSTQDTLTRIAAAKPGATVTITGLRGTERFESKVKVGERPRNP